MLSAFQKKRYENKGRLWGCENEPNWAAPGQEGKRNYSKRTQFKKRRCRGERQATHLRETNPIRERGGQELSANCGKQTQLAECVMIARCFHEETYVDGAAFGAWENKPNRLQWQPSKCWGWCQPAQRRCASRDDTTGPLFQTNPIGWMRNDCKIGS